MEFFREAKKLVPNLRAEMLMSTSKAGIRAQLYDKDRGELVNDFLAIRGDNDVHILNAISPAWTCSLEMADFICDNYIDNS